MNDNKTGILTLGRGRVPCGPLLALHANGGVGVGNVGPAALQAQGVRFMCAGLPASLWNERSAPATTEDEVELLLNAIFGALEDGQPCRPVEVAPGVLVPAGIAWLALAASMIEVAMKEEPSRPAFTGLSVQDEVELADFLAVSQIIDPLFRDAVREPVAA